ncbi:hypothetical protein TNCV_1167301 [Trichonephila clavipes]|uniref:Uncharacterized protein n=1 Tax=Trichonephila clavipes TaxID=2585209 RepID=A0A8X6T242_TRICX|nr:hypothetical protein TNCV_1167301 [Trichonephila clavipes]
MDKCVQMWTRNYGALGQTARVCFGVLCANRTREVKRDFCDLPIRRSEGRVVNTPLVVKKGSFSGDKEKRERAEKRGQERPGRENGRKEEERKREGDPKREVGRGGQESPGERTDGRRRRKTSRRWKKRVGERESEARLEWRKGLSPEIGVKKTMNAGGVEKGKGQPQKDNKKRNEITQANAALITPGLSFAQAIQGKNPQQRAARGNGSSASNNDNNDKNKGINLEALNVSTGQEGDFTFL